MKGSVNVPGVSVADLKKHENNQENVHKVTKEQVGLGYVPNVTTDNQTPTFTEAPTLANIVSGEKMSTIMGKIMKAITDLISHLENKNNPHAVSPEGIGAAKLSHGNHVPTTETANNARFLRNDNTWQAVTPGNIGAAPAYIYSTTDLTAGTSSLTTGQMYLMYE